MRTATQILLLAFIGISVQCPEGYIPDPSGDGTCNKYVARNVDRNSAAIECAKDSAMLVHVHNAFENSQLVGAGGGADIWLGLMCNGSSAADCYWDDDDTSPTDYNNFPIGQPNIDDFGPCVYATGKSGVWMSGDCTLQVHQFSCHYDPKFDCGDYFFYSRMCYKPYFDGASNELTTFNEAEHRCQNECGHLVSIHDQNENDYVQTLINLDKDPSDLNAMKYAYIGAFSKSWVDGTGYSYTNYQHENQNLGSCSAYTIAGDDIDTAGKWINVECNTNLYYICKRNTGPCVSTATPPIIEPPTAAPATCNGPVYLDDHGFFYSPAYPNEYPSTQQTCTYLLSSTVGTVSLYFDQLQLDNASYIQIFDTFIAKDPILVIAQGTEFDQPVTSKNNEMKVQFVSIRPDDDSNGHLWKARFASNQYNGAVSYCNATIIGPGVQFTSPSFPQDYPASFYCFYNLENDGVDAARGISVTFDSIITQQDHDFIKIYDGPTTSYPLLDSLSGNVASKTYSSTRSQLLVTFESDSSIQFQGFRAHTYASYIQS